MSYEELALFQVWPDRSWPFITDFVASESNDRQFGRRVVNPVFSQADASRVSFEDGGETATILCSGFKPGCIVLCARINHQWYAVRPAFYPTQLVVVVSGGSAGDEIRSTSRDGVAMFFPNMIELVTTGDNKEVLDGLYPLIPKNNGSGTLMTASNKYCIDFNLSRKQGASVILEIACVLSGSTGTYEYTVTFTHSSITTTVYSATTTTTLTKDSGDDSMPDDITFRYSPSAMMPLWFDIESDEDALTGMYTLWPSYYIETSSSWGAVNTGYIHGTDGTRKSLTISEDLFSGTPDYFRIQIGVPSGGALRYNCELPDWSNQNGDRITFTLDTNTSSATVPDTIEVRRPATGYCRTPRKEDQLT